MVDSVAVPPRVAALPTYKGYPIPAASYVGADGTPDFKVLDEAKRRRFIANRLCGVCGEVMGYWIVFVGGDLSVQNRRFMDPAMHEECARYSAAVCPYLSHSDADYATTVKPKDDVTIVTHQVVSAGRPTRIALYFTRQYTVESRGGAMVIVAAPAKTIEWVERQ